MSTTSKPFCCVPRCRSGKSKYAVLFKFPRDGVQRKKWVEQLELEEELDENMKVCSLHFLPTDFRSSAYLPNKSILRRGAIPALKLFKTRRIPERRTLGLKKRIKEAIKAPKSKHNTRRKRQKSSETESEDESLTCKAILDSCKRRNNGQEEISEVVDTIVISDRDDESVYESKRKKKKNKEDRVKPFIFVDVKKIARNSTHSLQTKRPFRPNILRKPVKNSNEKKDLKETNKYFKTPTFKSIASQTEACPDSHTSNEMSLSKVIEFLRDNLLKKPFKIEGDNYKIKDCTFSFENKDNRNENINILIIGSNCLTSSGRVTLDSIIESEADKVSETADNIEPIPQPSENHIPVKDFYIISNDTDSSRRELINNLSPDMNKTMPSNDLTENKDPKVMLSKLPECLEKAVRDGKSVKVETNKFVENGTCYKRYTVKAIRKLPLVSQPVGCSVCLSIFSTVDDLNEHLKSHPGLVQNDSSTLQVPSIEMNVTNDVPHSNDIEIVQQEESPVMNQKKDVKEEKVVPQKRLVPEMPNICDVCGRKFKYIHSLYYHRKLKHGKVDESRDITEKPEYLMSSKEPCPECPNVFWNTNDLERHLLDSHQTVLKKATYDCNKCSKMFITFRSLQYHEDKVHNAIINENIKIKSKCHGCNKLFELENFSKHVRECQADKQKENPNVLKDTASSEPVYFHEELLENYVNKENFNEETVESETDKGKRKYVSMNGNEKPEAKKLNLSEESDKINKLKALLESTDGPNDIIIVNIDD